MYNYQQIDKLINRYLEIEDNEILQTSEGILGSGNWILTAPNKKTIIVTEIYVNSWNSTYTIKTYNNTPKKYLKLLNKI